MSTLIGLALAWEVISYNNKTMREKTLFHG